MFTKINAFILIKLGFFILKWIYQSVIFVNNKNLYLCLNGKTLTLKSAEVTVGGGTKFIPLTGVTLPLVSYGGTSVLCTVIMFAAAGGVSITYADEENDEYLDLYYVDPTSQEETLVWYDDAHFEEDNDPDYNDVILYYYPSEDGEEVVEYGLYNEDLLIDPELEVVDLSYFFNGTLDEYIDNVDTIFYTDYYKEENGVVGRQFYCQYPDQETINRCGVMKDYGENNKLVMAMWENFKSDPLPNGSLTLFFVILGILLFLVALAISNVIIKKHIRKKRLLNSK